jgi:hypothetical protein
VEDADDDGDNLKIGGTGLDNFAGLVDNMTIGQK